MSIGGQEMIVIVVAVVLLFGATRIPALARSLGRSKNEFKKGLEDEPGDEQKKPEEKPKG